MRWKTYLRSFYKDPTRPTGWNNMLLPNVAMPHVLWELQGVQKIKTREVADPHSPGKMLHEFGGFEQVSPGSMNKLEFDTAVADALWNGDDSKRGAAVYIDNCAACHRTDGHGYTRVA